MKKLFIPKYGFNWQHNNQFELFCDGPVFFPAMLADINHAKKYILIEMYLIEPGNISQSFFLALNTAAERGVKIYLLFDAFGSRSLEKQDLLQLQTPNIKLCYYNPLQLKNKKLALFRDHRKLLIVDGVCAYTGGAGFKDEFADPKHPQNNWRENMLKIQGDNVLQWQTLFIENWQKWSQDTIEIASHLTSTHQQKGRVTITSGPQKLEIKRSFINQVRNAKGRVWICTPYFAPSHQLRRVLRKAARKSVDVRLLIPGNITDSTMARHLGQKYYAGLLKTGVRIFEYQPRFIHAKLILCDQWVSLGSCNFDRWNFRFNLDANQEIEDPDFTAIITDTLLNDFKDCLEIDCIEWGQRSILNRLKIGYWSFVTRFLDSFLLRWKTLRQWKSIGLWNKKP